MLTELLFPQVPHVHVDRVWWDATTLHVEMHTTRRRGHSSHTT